MKVTLRVNGTSRDVDIPAYVIQAPDERQLSGLLDRIDRSLFHPDAVEDPVAQPLVGRKLQVNTDWGRE